MRYLDQTLASPPENLALDEALLIEAEAGGGEVLRFWESPTPFVVVGIGAKVEHEVYRDLCQTRNIPVLRRCSGGGTVVQGPGCLNYALVLSVPESGPLTTIQGTNQLVMQRNAKALSSLVRQAISIQGHTDLALNGMKFSGNAQRRLRRHLLFHGTFLLHFNLSLISELLPIPTLQPPYRRNRSHEAFLENLNLSSTELKSALKQEWDAEEPTSSIPRQRTATLVEERYGCAVWNLRR